MKELARCIDQTFLKPEVTPEDIRVLCKGAIKHGFFSVCVNPCYVALVAQILQDTLVKVCTVVGFLLDAGTSGAAVESDIRLVMHMAGGAVKIKELGGIKDRKTALAMIKAGADRIGTSRAEKILREE